MAKLLARAEKLPEDTVQSQLAAIQDHLHTVAHETTTPCRHHGRTGTAAAGEGQAGAALDVLRGRPEVDPAKLGGIGFCFGGSTVLQLARGGVDLKGVVSFHGGLQTKAPAQAGSVKASVLCCTGADDPMIAADQVVAFEQEMRAAGADWQVVSYGNTVHSFTNPEADGSLNPAILYNEKTDRRSWAAMRGFFQERFGA